MSTVQVAYSFLRVCDNLRQREEQFFDYIHLQINSHLVTLNPAFTNEKPTTRQTMEQQNNLKAILMRLLTIPNPDSSTPLPLI